LNCRFKILAGGFGAPRPPPPNAVELTDCCGPREPERVDWPGERKGRIGSLISDACRTTDDWPLSREGCWELELGAANDDSEDVEVKAEGAPEGVVDVGASDEPADFGKGSIS
jgi:hypothetical protein